VDWSQWGPWQMFLIYTVGAFARELMIQAGPWGKPLGPAFLLRPPPRVRTPCVCTLSTSRRRATCDIGGMPPFWVNLCGTSETKSGDFLPETKTMSQYWASRCIIYCVRRSAFGARVLGRWHLMIVAFALGMALGMALGICLTRDAVELQLLRAGLLSPDKLTDDVAPSPDSCPVIDGAFRTYLQF
jgi:hypothetical protein